MCKTEKHALKKMNLITLSTGFGKSLIKLSVNAVCFKLVASSFKNVSYDPDIHQTFVAPDVGQFCAFSNEHIKRSRHFTA